ncbi:hypothetical protein OG828_34745 [Streptomyces sp. NBC_00457]|uniref:hypothetical protein n=1 Tax=Streptomyces sp. NBC_00457 TaxID=2975748 RepID=UPI002E20B2D6
MTQTEHAGVFAGAAVSFTEVAVSFTEVAVSFTEVAVFFMGAVKTFGAVRAVDGLDLVTGS